LVRSHAARLASLQAELTNLQAEEQAAKDLGLQILGTDVPEIDFHDIIARVMLDWFNSQGNQGWLLILEGLNLDHNTLPLIPINKDGHGSIVVIGYEDHTGPLEDLARPFVSSIDISPLTEDESDKHAKLLLQSSSSDNQSPSKQRLSCRYYCTVSESFGGYPVAVMDVTNLISCPEHQVQQESSADLSATWITEKNFRHSIKAPRKFMKGLGATARGIIDCCCLIPGQFFPSHLLTGDPSIFETEDGASDNPERSSRQYYLQT
jgi:hypothetical protein